jgi:hypothetical protein
MTALATAANASHAADPITVILLALAVAAGYAVSLYLFPWQACPRCRGTRVNTGRRARMCPRCSGTGRTRRRGATAVHRFYWSAVGDQRHARRRATIQRLRASYQDLIADTRATTDTRQARDDLRRRQHDEPPDL